MRKLFILISTFISISVFGQFPNTQSISNANTILQVPANGGFRAGIINRTFADTTAANLTYLDAYQGAQIFTTSDAKFWVRNATATGWIDIAGSGSSSQRISALLAANQTNTIDNANYEQLWRWNSLSGKGLRLNSTTTLADEGQNLLEVSVAGANAQAGIYTYGINVSNSHTGGGINVAANFAATGGSSNYAALFTSGNVGIGTSTPAASSLLDITSTSKGFLPPRMTGAQQNAISSPATGLMIYNTDSSAYCYYTGSVWLKISQGSGSTPTWQQTLTAGSTLTGNNTIIGGGFNYTHNMGGTGFYEVTEGDSARITSRKVILHGVNGISLWGADEDDNDNIFPLSDKGAVAIGSGNSISVNKSVAIGINNTIEGIGGFGFAIGESNYIGGVVDDNIAIGFIDSVTGGLSTAMGHRLHISGDESFGINLGRIKRNLTEDSTFAIFNNSTFKMGVDSITIIPINGAINIGVLRDATNENRLIGWNNSTGRVGALSTIPSGVGVPISSITNALANNTVTGASRAYSFSLTDFSDLHFQAGSGAPGNEIDFEDGSGNMEILANNGSLTLNATNDIYIKQNVFGSNIANGDFRIRGTSNATKTTSYVTLQEDGGNVGIGTSTPAKIFHTVGTVRHETLGTASSDTTTNKPLGINSSGDVIPMTYWPGGGGSSSPSGNYGNLQINRNSAFATPGSDSLDFESATGLSVKGNIIANAAGDASTSTLNPQVLAYPGTNYYGFSLLYQNSRYRTALYGAQGADVGIGVMATGATIPSNFTEIITVRGDNSRVGISEQNPTAKLHLPAGTASANTAPLKLTTGTNLTTAEAGALEYTTPQLFFTNGAAVRQELFQGNQNFVQTQFDKTSNTTLGNVTNLSVNVAAGKAYRFEAILYTSSNSSGGVKVAISGTATATTIIYEGLTTDAGTTTQSRATSLGTAVGAVTAVTAAYIKITGTIIVNAAGTLTVQFAQNASNGSASSVLVGSTFHVIELAYFP